MDRDREDVDGCSCGPACLLPAVVSIAATGSGKALDFTKGFVVKKLCSLTTVADSRLSILDHELSQLPFTVRFSSSSKGEKQCCSAGDLIALTVKDLISWYGKPLYLTYNVSAPTVQSGPPTRNAFATMMATARQKCWPSPPSKNVNKHLDMQGDFIQWLKDEGIGWRADEVESHGVPFVRLMCDVLWYIEPQQTTLRARSCAVPELFMKFTGYNMPAQHGHKIAPLSSSILHDFIRQLERCCVQLWLEKSNMEWLSL